MKSTLKTMLKTVALMAALGGAGAVGANPLATLPVATTLTSSGAVSASTVKAEPANAAPLGLQIDVETLEGAWKVLTNDLGIAPSQIKKETESADEHTIMNIGTAHSYRVDAKAFGVDGLKGTVDLVFYEKEPNSGGPTLQIVTLTFDKDVVGMVSELSEKYTPISSNVNKHLNFGEAQFKQGESIIMVDGPHLGFDMTVMYGSTDFFRRVVESHEADLAKQEARRKSLL